MALFRTLLQQLYRIDNPEFQSRPGQSRAFLAGAGAAQSRAFLAGAGAAQSRAFLAGAGAAQSRAFLAGTGAKQLPAYWRQKKMYKIVHILRFECAHFYTFTYLHVLQPKKDIRDDDEYKLFSLFNSFYSLGLVHRPVILLYGQYLAGCRDSNPSCCYLYY